MMALRNSQGVRLDELAKVQQDIQTMLQSSADVVRELSSFNPNTDLAQMKSQEFLSTLKRVHASLSQHIIYLNKVSSGVAHSSSIYGLEKDYELSVQELEVVKAKVEELKDQSHLSQHNRQ